MNRDGRGTILVLENHRQTLAVTRSLQGAGYRVLLGVNESVDGGAFVASSNSVDEVWLHPSFFDKRFESSFRALLRSEPLTAVFPVGEEAIQKTLPLAAEFESVPFIIASPLEKCLDKLAVYEIAAGAGLPCAGAREVSDYATVAALACTEGYPFILKQVDSSKLLAGEKCFFVRDQDTLQGLKSVLAGKPRLVYQREAKGLRHNCMFSAMGGTLLQYFESTVYRTDRPNGSGFAVVACSERPTRQLLEYTGQLVETLNYTGIGCAQFLVDNDTGSCTFLELNPRLDATATLPLYCAVDFPKAALSIAGIGPPPDCSRVDISNLVNQPGYEVGKFIYWLQGDARAGVQLMVQGEISLMKGLYWGVRALRDAVTADYHMIWSWRDPRPALRAHGDLVRSASRKAVQRLTPAHRH